MVIASAHSRTSGHEIFLFLEQPPHLLHPARKPLEDALQRVVPGFQEGMGTRPDQLFVELDHTFMQVPEDLVDAVPFRESP